MHVLLIGRTSWHSILQCVGSCGTDRFGAEAHSPRSAGFDSFGLSEL